MRMGRAGVGPVRDAICPQMCGEQGGRCRLAGPTTRLVWPTNSRANQTFVPPTLAQPLQPLLNQQATGWPAGTRRGRCLPRSAPPTPNCSHPPAAAMLAAATRRAAAATAPGCRRLSTVKLPDLPYDYRRGRALLDGRRRGALRATRCARGAGGTVAGCGGQGGGLSSWASGRLGAGAPTRSPAARRATPTPRHPPPTLCFQRTGAGHLRRNHGAAPLQTPRRLRCGAGEFRLGSGWWGGARGRGVVGGASSAGRRRAVGHRESTPSRPYPPRQNAAAEKHAEARLEGLWAPGFGTVRALPARHGNPPPLPTPSVSGRSPRRPARHAGPAARAALQRGWARQPLPVLAQPGP